MNNKCIFTICSKNYLAQALTLKSSVLKHVRDVDFFLFLADKPNEEIIDLDIELLDENWIPTWKQMAFKYDVIEFNTSIKPFCFKKLFLAGYRKVVYLDPDTYVTSDLSNIWDNLNNHSIILVPHISRLELNYTGAQPEAEVLSVGCFNLGFCAIANTEHGINIVDWWCIRLEGQCYAYKGLFVDQKWMNFIPCFYPDDVLISKHYGLNVAIWNLHERNFEIHDNKYYVRSLESDELFPLLFFHFSGFDPQNTTVINRRHPKFGIEKYPSFKHIIDEYKKCEYDNGYDKYSKMKYSFNEYSNGYEILPLHRRLYRATKKAFINDDPFSIDNSFYKNLEASKLIYKHKNTEAMYRDRKNLSPKEKVKFASKYQRLSRLFQRIIGIKRYSMLLSYGQAFCEFENQAFLMQDMQEVDKNSPFVVSD